MCTDFLLTATDGSVVNGRSMEYGANLGSQILVGGVGTSKTSTAPKPGGGREPGMTWTATYGYVGMNAAGLRDGYGDLLKNMITDGMNSAGLAISAKRSIVKAFLQERTGGSNQGAKTLLGLL